MRRVSRQNTDTGRQRMQDNMRDSEKRHSTLRCVQLVVGVDIPYITLQYTNSCGWR
ncbi:hypothetical protein DPMN_099757 [Dreissena polymorpha]|uniref:Uncharacterized protein n=1 Tax=Dreissena polymorpha TaxID=45954 RepID=A0A9D4LGX7_DREPO|nr:hypothetical protein DPMN_099757 [Dreissena polymorpha]